MKRQLCIALIAGMLLVGAERSQAAILFSDNFSTSTLNSATPAAPTATSTNYQVLSSKDARGSSIGAGSLDLAMGNTSSGFAEVQALFASAPVALTQSGDYIEAKVEFTSAGINLAGNSTLNVALLNSGGTPPVPGTELNNGQLDDAGVFTSGGAAGWQGYVGRIGVVGGASSQLFTRPAQGDKGTAEVQDVLFNNAGGGAFDNPSGTTIQGGGAGATLTNGTPYTLLLRATYDADTALVSLDYTLADANGTIDALTGTTDLATTTATAFDAFAIGFRGTDSMGPYSLNMSSLEISTNVAAIPEPGTLCLLIPLAAMVVGGRRGTR